MALTREQSVGNQFDGKGSPAVDAGNDVSRTQSAVICNSNFNVYPPPAYIHLLHAQIHSFLSFYFA